LLPYPSTVVGYSLLDEPFPITTIPPCSSFGSLPKGPRSLGCASVGGPTHRLPLGSGRLRRPIPGPTSGIPSLSAPNYLVIFHPYYFEAIFIGHLPASGQSLPGDFTPNNDTGVILTDPYFVIVGPSKTLRYRCDEPPPAANGIHIRPPFTNDSSSSHQQAHTGPPDGAGGGTYRGFATTPGQLPFKSVSKGAAGSFPVCT